MRLTRSNPLTPTNDFDRLFDNVWTLPTWPAGGQGTEAVAWKPPLGFSETATEYLVRLEVPGVARDDLDVSYDGNLLTLRGRRESRTSEQGEDFLVEERSWGRFSRTVRIPGPFDAAKLDASYNDGILTVRIPKAQPAIRNKIQIR